MCKHGNMFSLAVLIGRGLDQVPPLGLVSLLSISLAFALFSFQGTQSSSSRMGFFLLFAWDFPVASPTQPCSGETALVLSACQEEGPSGMSTLWIELQVERA